MLIILVILCLCTASFKRNKKHRYKKTNSLNLSTTDTPGYSPLPYSLMKYDAFLSYSKNDEKEVLEELWRLIFT